MFGRYILQYGIFVIIGVFQANFNQVRAKATLEDAQQALKTMQNESLKLISIIATNKYNIEVDFYGTLDSEKAAALQEIETRLEDVQSKIANITGNAEAAGINVTSCVEGATSDILGFAQELKDNLPECIGRSLSEAFDLVDQAWADVVYLDESTSKCANRSIIECHQYEDDDNCFEFVVSVMEGSKERLLKSLTYLNVIILNKLQSYTLPCRDLIANQMAIYPSLIVDYVNTCINRVSENQISNIC